MSMIEEPMFVPFANEHVAAVLTVPDDAPRALVLLLQGHGQPRSHGNRLWTRLARALAERGFASVRMDFPWLGDSTGDPLAPESPPVEEAMAIGRVALDAAGVDRFAIVGDCLGSRAALAIASRMESCLSVACIYRGSLTQGVVRRGRTTVGRAMWKVARRMPRLRAMVRRVVRSDRLVPRFQFEPEVAAVVQSTSVLFLFPAGQATADHVRGLMSSLVEQSLGKGSGRMDVRGIPVLGTSQFPTSSSVQPAVIESLVNWMDETLPGSDGLRPDVAGPSVEVKAPFKRLPSVS